MGRTHQEPHPGLAATVVAAAAGLEELGRCSQVEIGLVDLGRIGKTLCSTVVYGSKSCWISTFEEMSIEGCKKIIGSFQKKKKDLENSSLIQSTTVESASDGK